MFTRTQVDEVICEIEKHNAYFVSEAHFQMSFLFEAYKKFGNENIVNEPVESKELDKSFTFIPEYPVINGAYKLEEKDDSKKSKRDEIDLVIVGNKTEQKTFIEFKHKTKNDSKFGLDGLPIYGVKDNTFTPKNHAAQNLGRYDCWHDIKRIEYYVEQKKADNGFFIFLTNDPLYWEKDGDGDFGKKFQMINKRQYPANDTKEWNGEIEDIIHSIGTTRKNPITIHYSYTFDYKPYPKLGKYNNHKYGQFMLLIVEIPPKQNS